MSDPDDCSQCGGSRLHLGDWMGPTQAAPMPEPCPRCSADITPRERQVLGIQWLMDNQHRDVVREIMARIATFNAKTYKTVIHLPNATTWTQTKCTAADVAEADLVVCGSTVIKDRNGMSNYSLSRTELRRIQDDAEKFVVIR